MKSLLVIALTVGLSLAAAENANADGFFTFGAQQSGTSSKVTTINQSINGIPQPEIRTSEFSRYQNFVPPTTIRVIGNQLVAPPLNWITQPSPVSEGSIYSYPAPTNGFFGNQNSKIPIVSSPITPLTMPPLSLMGNQLIENRFNNQVGSFREF